MNFGFIKRRLLPRNWRRRRSDEHLRLGRRGERVAARYLKTHGHRIIARNYRCPVGEIDLVSIHQDMIVFVEVKTRSSDEAEDPRETAGPTKWARVERAARYFLTQRSAVDGPCRFDLVTVVWPARTVPRVEHIEDAYQPRRS